MHSHLTTPIKHLVPMLGLGAPLASSSASASAGRVGATVHAKFYGLDPDTVDDDAGAFVIADGTTFTFTDPFYGFGSFMQVTFSDTQITLTNLVAGGFANYTAANFAVPHFSLASQSDLLNAPVSGIGGTARIILDDNTISKTPKSEFELAMAHELGQHRQPPFEAARGEQPCQTRAARVTAYPAISPRRAAVAAWSPGLNTAGNSLVVALALERVARRTGWSFF